MILVDAIYINNSGGKILLDYLIINLEKSNTKILYLLDTRVINKIPSIKNSNDVIFLKNNLFNRHNFYYHNKISFNKIICFGNIPPPLKNKAIVYTYFHQLLFLEKVKNLKYLDKIKLYFKKKYLNNLEKLDDNYQKFQKNGFVILDKLLLNEQVKFQIDISISLAKNIFENENICFKAFFHAKSMV